MEIITLSKLDLIEGESPLLMEGKVISRRIVSADGSAGEKMGLGLIKFFPGGRTKLHTHNVEQVLYIVEGKGIVATDKEEYEATPGMLFRIPAGEKHWHGAARDTGMSHLSIQLPGSKLEVL